MTDEVEPYVEKLRPEDLAIAQAIGDPAAFLSTSAQLRETQAALAASQADLTAMERERNEARAGLSNALRCFDDLQTAAGRKYLAYEAELTSARTELEQLRRDQSRSVAEWRALLGALGIDPATVETPLMQAKRIGQLAAEVPALRAELEQRNQYVATLERSLSDADAAIERLRGEP